MTNLTKNQILKIAQTHPHLQNAELNWDEPGKCIISLRDGITWEALDGNRHVEGFVYSDAGLDDRDSLQYFKHRLNMIEPEDPNC